MTDQTLTKTSVSGGNVKTLSHNVYTAKNNSDLLDSDSADTVSPKGVPYIEPYLEGRIDEIHRLATDPNPNIRDRMKRIRQAVAELRTHWYLRKGCGS